METLLLIQPKMATKNYKKLIREALEAGELSRADFERRLRALQTLGREVFQKIERTWDLTLKRYLNIT